MAQTLSQILSSISMATPCPLVDICPGDVTVRELGALPCGTVISAPLHKGQKTLLNLAPGDEWLDIVGANADTLPHHVGEAAQALHMAVRIDAVQAGLLDALEHRVKQSAYDPVYHRIIWKNMHCGDGKIIMNLILEEAQSLTALKFVEGGSIKKGTGRAFLDEHLGHDSLTDFKCKPIVELEFIHKTEDYITISLSVNSVIFAPVPRRKVVVHSQDDEAAAIQSAKRFKYIL